MGRHNARGDHKALQPKRERAVNTSAGSLTGQGPYNIVLPSEWTNIGVSATY